ncbi:unnamed protein product [Parnassius apollo]|uniref:(apollo) hypothetical protein n=1 Tax=Parnassius apollo TaxID=110799 RepID=A0A8S3WS42_PARAO|nr:unnamed protein product [Parnassius apollo]
MESKRRRVVRSEGRQMIASVYHFLKTEYEFTVNFKEPNCDISHLRNIAKRTAEATGVSERTVQRILKEERDLPSTSSRFLSPMRNRRKRESKVHIDGLTADVVRSTIQEFYIVLKKIPTLAKLRSDLNEKLGFNGCLTTLRTLLRKLGFMWRKTDNNRKVLVERHDIQILRLQYLKKITEYRSQGRPIVYTDESYVLATQDRKNIRFIVVHAGTYSGFIDNACLIYKANLATGDNNSNMSFENYVNWLNNKLLPNLPDRSVIVLDTASYHNARAEKLPTTASKKSEMQQWLTAKGIQFDSNMRKVEIYDIIKKHKSNFIAYKIDNYIKSKGFEVLRLPPYHPELNAFENIWGVLKNFVALRDGEQNMNDSDTEKLIHEGIDKITSEIWHNTCNSIIKKEAEYMKYFDTEFEFITNLQDDSNDETDTEDDSNYDSS